jgi:hypothetical protein
MSDVMIVGRGGPNDPRALPLSTRKRNFIPNEPRLPRPLKVLNAGHDILKMEIPDACLRTLSSEYNCMGMIFGARRTWIDPDQFFLITSDDGYRLLPPGEQRLIGDVAVYRSKTNSEVVHVGVVVDAKLDETGSGLQILSKFGADGEYFHLAEEVPTMFSMSGGYILEFWTDRRCQ